MLLGEGGFTSAFKWAEGKRKRKKKKKKVARL